MAHLPVLICIPSTTAASGFTCPVPVVGPDIIPRQPYSPNGWCLTRIPFLSSLRHFSALFCLKSRLRVFFHHLRLAGSLLFSIFKPYQTIHFLVYAPLYASDAVLSLSGQPQILFRLAQRTLPTAPKNCDNARRVKLA